METKKKSGVFKKVILGLLISIPIITISAVFLFRYFYIPNNEEVIEKLSNMKGYKTDVTYTIINTQGKYEEKTKQYYSKEKGTRVEFGEERVKIYKDGSINIKENDSNDEYEMSKNLDSFYPLAFLNNILNNNYTEIQEGQEEWGDTKYIQVLYDLNTKNNHIKKAKVYIDKNKCMPIAIKIYDYNNKEKAIISYDDFEELKEIDNGLF
ncbi:MAG: germination lipoprotein GerS-related protein [Clostridium sp.]